MQLLLEFLVEPSALATSSLHVPSLDAKPIFDNYDNISLLKEKHKYIKWSIRTRTMLSAETLLLLSKENNQSKGKLMPCDTIETCYDLKVLFPPSRFKEKMQSMIAKRSRAC